MKKNIPVTLGITRSGGNVRQSPKNKKGAAALTILPQKIKQDIHERDDHTCRCCGFRSQKYQDIHYINDVNTDHKPENLATICIFCHQCFNIDKISTMRSGVLIWLPEIKQIQLHHIARAVYVARISQGPMADAARHALDVLMKRRDEVRKRLGTDDAFILSTVLKDYVSGKAYKARKEKLEGIRLFPLDRRIIKEADLEFNQFPQILAYWRSKDGPFGGKVPRQWVNIYREVSNSKLGNA